MDMPVLRCRMVFISVVLIGCISCDHSPRGTSNSSPGGARPHGQAAPRKQVYDASADTHAEIEKAVAEARADGKRILLVFGANWCPECIVLDARFHEPPAQPVVDANFHVVHVDIGRGDDFLDGSPSLNLELAKKYEIPLSMGVPAVAVLDRDGSLLHSQKDGEWAPEGVSTMAIVAFLNRWKSAGH
jgi:thiol:disulfide interchange protein